MLSLYDSVIQLHRKALFINAGRFEFANTRQKLSGKLTMKLLTVNSDISFEEIAASLLKCLLSEIKSYYSSKE